MAITNSVSAFSGSSAFTIAVATRNPRAPSSSDIRTSSAELTPAPTKSGIPRASLTDRAIDSGWAVATDAVVDPINSGGSKAMKSGSRSANASTSSGDSAHTIRINPDFWANPADSDKIWCSTLASEWLINVPIPPERFTP